MKKSIYFILAMLVFTSCEELGLVDPGADLIGTWIHVRSGAASGGNGSYTYNGSVISIPQTLKNSNLNLTFQKKGVCDCGDYDKYKVSGNTLTLIDSSTDDTLEYDYSIVKDGLALIEKLSEWKKVDPKVTKIELTHNYDKQ